MVKLHPKLFLRWVKQTFYLLDSLVFCSAVAFVVVIVYFIRLEAVKNVFLSSSSTRALANNFIGNSMDLWSVIFFFFFFGIRFTIFFVSWISHY